MGFAGAVTHQLMVWFDGEAHDPLHVDVTVCNRRDMRELSSWVLVRIGLNFALHGGGIPGQHDIGEQGEGAAEAAVSSSVRPCFASIRPASKARCRAWSDSPWASRR